jgi:hypothetical protein
MTNSAFRCLGASINQLLTSDPAGVATRIAEHWRDAEAAHDARRDLPDYLVNPTRPAGRSLMEPSGAPWIRLDPRAMTSPATTENRFVLCPPRPTHCFPYSESCDFSSAGVSDSGVRATRSSESAR